MGFCCFLVLSQSLSQENISRREICSWRVHTDLDIQNYALWARPIDSFRGKQDRMIGIWKAFGGRRSHPAGPERDRNGSGARRHRASPIYNILIFFFFICLLKYTPEVLHSIVILCILYISNKYIQWGVPMWKYIRFLFHDLRRR